jgi:hypothetical protein
VGQDIHITVDGKTVTATITGTVYAPGGIHGALLTSWPTLSGAAGLAVNQYVVALRPGITPPAYAAALGHALGHGYTVDTIQPGQSGSVGLYGDVDTPSSDCLPSWSPCWPGSACSTRYS